MKKTILALIAFLIVLAVFNIVSFLVPFLHTLSFWIGWAFANAALIASCVIAACSSAGRQQKHSKFYHLSLITVAVIFTAIEVSAGLTFMILSWTPVWITVICCVIGLALLLLGTIGTQAATDHAEAIDHEIRQKTFYLRSIQSDVEGFALGAGSETMKRALKELSEDIRYSDPMSADGLVSLENRIMGKIDEIGALVNTDEEAARALCAETRALIAERNRKCKMLK